MGSKDEKPLVLPIKNNVVEVRQNEVKSLIYFVRGKQVMLDSDLSFLYQVETSVLNRSAQRNIDRFPPDFRFQLTKEEFEILKSQSVVSRFGSDRQSHGGRRKLPYVYTEQGISMLSSVLRSDVAARVSVTIMRAFVEMRRFIAGNSLLFERVRDVELKQMEFEKEAGEKFEEIFHYISTHEESSQKIFYAGQIYDAFAFLGSLISQAEQDIILIDGYVDIMTLNLLAKKKDGVNVAILTFAGSALTQADIAQFNAQYPTLTLHYGKEFHDRFLIMDGKDGYHIGASLKDAGKKCFAISRIEDRENVDGILQRMNLSPAGKAP